MKLNVNGQERELPVRWADEALVDVLREALQLVGTRMGCGTGECGCCVVHVDGRALRSCRITGRQAQGRRILTIEGLAAPGGPLHPVQQAWIAERVSQCGYCQAGMIMAVAARWNEDPTTPPADLARQVSGHACRCGTYPRVRRAIERLRLGGPGKPIDAAATPVRAGHG